MSETGTNTVQILSKANHDMQAAQSKAMRDLEDALGLMRSRTQQVIDQFAPPPPTPSDPIAIGQLELEKKGWTKVVTVAAILDKDFQDRVGNEAYHLLVDRGVLPPSPAPPAPSGG